MVEITVKTSEGDKICETSGVRTPPANTEGQVRRIMPVDLDGPVGQFLSGVLCEIAPHSFGPSNWKGKLSTFITSKTSLFICFGRAIGLAYLQQDPMSGINSAKAMFCLVADGGTEQDGYEILKDMRRWARDLDLELILPSPDFCNLAPGKMANFMKAQKREEWVVPALAKK